MGIGYQKEIDNLPQSSTNPLFQYYLINEIQTNIALTALVSADDEVINVAVGHGFVGIPGEFLVIREGDLFEQCEVKNVSVNAITVCMPVASGFSIDAKVIRGSNLVNVDGSSTPVDFKFSFNSGAIVPIDISKVVISMQSGANVPDNGKFGGMAELPNGFYFRKVNGTNVNLGNYRTNQDFKDRGAQVDYTTKAPAGTNATDITFNIEEIFEQVQRIDPRINDAVVARSRDALNTLVKMTISIIGSYTEGE